MSFPNMERIKSSLERTRFFDSHSPEGVDLIEALSDLQDVYNYARILEADLARERNAHEITRVREQQFRNEALHAKGSL